MELERANITEKQERESETLGMKYRQVVDRVQCQFASEERPIVARIANLEKDLADLRGGTVRLGLPPDSGDPRDELMSPRTARRFCGYKARGLVPKLDVPPMDCTPQREKEVRTCRVRGSTAFR
jgi:hypothetical protein